MPDDSLRQRIVKSRWHKVVQARVIGTIGHISCRQYCISVIGTIGHISYTQYCISVIGTIGHKGTVARMIGPCRL